MEQSSGVGVVDKTVTLLDAVAAGPCTLAVLVARTGIPRPTAHRLAVALEQHGVLARDPAGRFGLGHRLVEWGVGADPLLPRARHAVTVLRDRTGLSAQVYRRAGDRRLCVASAEPSSGLRDSVPVGAALSMQAGSGAQALVAWLPPAERRLALRGATFTSTDLERTRSRGYAHSLGQREPGVASVSAPVRDAAGLVTAAVSISGPIDRLRRPSDAQLAELLACARELSDSDEPENGRGPS